MENFLLTKRVRVFVFFFLFEKEIPFYGLVTVGWLKKLESVTYEQSFVPGVNCYKLSQEKNVRKNSFSKINVKFFIAGDDEIWGNFKSSHFDFSINSQHIWSAQLKIIAGESKISKS